MTEVNGPNGKRKFQLFRAWFLLLLGAGLLTWDLVAYSPGIVDPLSMPLYLALLGLGGIEFTRSR